MKNLLILILPLLLAVAPNAPVSWLQDTNVDMGDLRKDVDHMVVFEFKNTSPDSLFIDNVRVACGCTSPSWEDIMVPPDSIGQITITYDAHDPGYFQKWIKVYFNGYRKAEKLWIEGYVEQQ